MTTDNNTPSDCCKLTKHELKKFKHFAMIQSAKLQRALKFINWCKGQCGGITAELAENCEHELNEIAQRGEINAAR